jgi:hypothetical protein
MKKQIILFIVSILLTVTGHSQSRSYVTTSGEMIFSFATIEDNGRMVSSDIRWAPLFNIQSMANRDISNQFGLFTGIAMRNVGYIYDNYTEPSTGTMYKKKFRSYNVAVPVGIKIGNLEGMFFYGGYEVELPFLYKEKTFYAGDKINTTTGWFSTRQELFQHGFLVGVEFPYGFDLKFKYYVSEFHNRDFTDEYGNKPYSGLKSNVFYFSLSSYLFKNYHYKSQTHISL